MNPLCEFAVRWHAHDSCREQRVVWRTFSTAPILPCGLNFIEKLLAAQGKNNSTQMTQMKQISTVMFSCYTEAAPLPAGADFQSVPCLLPFYFQNPSLSKSVESTHPALVLVSSPFMNRE